MNKEPNSEFKNKQIAYFSMEIALESDVPIYSGGLGILAGDALRSAADLELPLIAVTLTYNAGYFYQKIAPDGFQVERDIEWNFSNDFQKINQQIELEIQDKKISVEAWKYNVIGRNGYVIPVILLDTDLPNNEPWQRNLTHVLYDANPFQRLVQEMILGICGIRMLQKLGYNEINTFHMNEGHAAFLIFELLKKYQTIEEVKKYCVFTTHTPVKAGLQEFDYNLVNDVFRDRLPENIKNLAGKNNLNMTLLALNSSRYTNAVSKKHTETSREMFPNYDIDSITNGIHLRFWLSKYMERLFNENFGRKWHYDLRILNRAHELDEHEIWRYHLKAKNDLIDYASSNSWILLDKKLLTIGFARRIAEYKRPLLLFTDLERLAKIAKKNVQFIFAGKAHPADNQAKSFIKKINEISDYLWNSYQICVLFLENYELNLAKMLISGVDVWLNTPRRYMEASGTSGMKAAINGILNFSVLDGWWIEGYQMSNKMGGWAIGPEPNVIDIKEINDPTDATDLYDKLEREILPLFKNNRKLWQERMKSAIKLGAYFNTNRMMEEYAKKSYKLIKQPSWKSLD